MIEKTVSYLEFEAVQARSERKERRLIITLIILSVLIFMSNMAWLWAFLWRV